MNAIKTDVGWSAELSVRMACESGRTVLRRQRQKGPFTIQKPFYPEDGVCHVYLLHPPGGIVGGDTIDVDVSVEPGAKALFTTPSATKVYRSAGLASVLTQRLRVASGATLEWLPTETMLFSGSRHEVRTSLELASDAACFCWDINVLGRPHSKDFYSEGDLDQRTEIKLDGEPLLIERLGWAGAREVLKAPWGLQGRTCVATAIVYPADRDLLEHVRRGLAASFPVAATLIADLLVVRALADDPWAVRDAFTEVWANVRPAVFGTAACPPRIWAT